MKYKAETFIIAVLAIALAMVYNRAVEERYEKEASPKGQKIYYEKSPAQKTGAVSAMTDKQKLSYLFLED